MQSKCDEHEYFIRRRRRRLKGIHYRSDTNRTGAEGLSFYYPRLLHCLNQMLAVMSLSQHRVSSSKTVRPRTPCGARCIGHAVSIWSAVCSEAPHLQFGGARSHLCMDEWNRPTPVRRWLSLTQAARDSPSQQAWHRSRAQKHGAWKHFHSTPFSICDLSIQKRGCQVWQGCPKDSVHLAQTDVWILVSLGEYLGTHLKTIQDNWVLRYSPSETKIQTFISLKIIKNFERSHFGSLNLPTHGSALLPNHKDGRTRAAPSPCQTTWLSPTKSTQLLQF